jgi:hypothetical protein
VVTVQGVSVTGKFGLPSRLSFYVQDCNDVKVVGTMLPTCLESAPDVPSRPANLTYVFIISKKNINIQFSWSFPHSDQPLKGWRIVWGKRLIHPQHGSRPMFKPYPVLDRKSAIPLLLGKDKTEFTIEKMEEATDYIIQLQALSEVGEGEIAQLIITTPQLSLGLPEDRYRDPFPQYPTDARPFDPDDGFDHEAKRTRDATSVNRASSCAQGLPVPRPLYFLYALVLSSACAFACACASASAFAFLNRLTWVEKVT